MKIKIGENLIDKICQFLTILFLTLVCTMYSDADAKYILFALAIVVAIMSVINNSGIIRFSFGYFHIFYIIFINYSLLSSLWSWDSSSTVRITISIFTVFLCVSLFYIYYQEKKELWILYNAVRWSGFLVCIYTFCNIGFTNFFSILNSNKRMDVDFVNVNTIGVLAAFAVIITIYETFYREYNIFSIIMCIPSMMVIAATGTRKALLMLIIGIIILVYFRFKDQDILKSIFKFIVIGIIVLFILRLVLSLPFFSGIMKRMEGLIALFTGQGKVDGSTLTRSRFIEIGIKQFLKKPISGIGIGSSGELLLKEYGKRAYLHNNFVELLACGGIVGFSIYYSMYAYCGILFWKNLNKSDPLTVLGFVMLAEMFIMDIARVSYYSKPTIFYFMIFFLHVRNLKKQGDVNEA